ncbi:DNA ligase [subsurface metagenome]
MEFQFQLCERGEWGKFPEGRLYERKLDGTRALAVKFGDKVKLVNRRGFEYTEQFPEIVADLRAYPHHALMLDGEICDRDFSTLAGHTHLQDRFKIEMRAKLHPCTFWVFDVLQSGSASSPRNRCPHASKFWRDLARA